MRDRNDERMRTRRDKRVADDWFRSPGLSLLTPVVVTAKLSDYDRTLRVGGGGRRWLAFLWVV